MIVIRTLDQPFLSIIVDVVSYYIDFKKEMTDNSILIESYRHQRRLC